MQGVKGILLPIVQVGGVQTRMACATQERSTVRSYQESRRRLGFNKGRTDWFVVQGVTGIMWPFAQVIGAPTAMACATQESGTSAFAVRITQF